MALIIAGELTVNAANDTLTFTDTTGVYNATTRPGGYGAPNKTTSAGFFTRYTFIYPDATTVNIDTDGSTTPSTDFLPKNALTREFTLTQLGLSELSTGVVQVNYKPYFATASGGSVTFTQGSAVVDRASGQVLTTDLNDTYMVLFQGIEYTIVTASITASQFTLTQTYTGSTATAVLYAGYSVSTAVLITKPFNDCYQPQWADLDVKKGCFGKDEQQLFHLYCIYLSVLAKMEETDYTGANLLMIYLTDLCLCVDSGGGCGC